MGFFWWWGWQHVSIKSKGNNHFFPFCLDAVLLKKLACKQAPMLNCGTGGKTMRDDVPTQWLPIILASPHSCFGTLALMQHNAYSSLSSRTLSFNHVVTRQLKILFYNLCCQPTSAKPSLLAALNKSPQQVMRSASDVSTQSAKCEYQDTNSPYIWPEGDIHADLTLCLLTDFHPALF